MQFLDVWIIVDVLVVLGLPSNNFFFSDSVVPEQFGLAFTVVLESKKVVGIFALVSEYHHHSHFPFIDISALVVFFRDLYFADFVISPLS